MDQHINFRQNRKAEQRLRIKFYFIGGSIALLIIGLIYVLLYSPVFKVRKFIVTGREYHSDEEILGIVEPLVVNTKFKKILGRQNLMAWNISRPDISKTALAEAIISRDWIRQSVKIRVRERGRLAIWCDMNNDCDWIDENGMAIEKAPQTEGSLIITIHDDSAKQIIQGANILEDRFIANLVSIIKNVAAMKLPIKRATYSPKLQEIRIENYGGPDLFFSIRFDPTQNISSLHTLQEKMDTGKINYIDLRVENRLYYK